MAKSIGVVGSFSGYQRLQNIASRFGYDICELSDVQAFLNVAAAEDISLTVVFFDLTKEDKKTVDTLIKHLLKKMNTFSTVVLQSDNPIYDVDALEEVVDYEIDLPIEEHKLLRLVARAARLAVIRQKLELSKTISRQKYSIDAYLGRSSAASNVRDLMHKLVSVPMSSIFISGETGTGKGLVARILHSQDQQQMGPLIEVNCAAIPGELLESELFGHEAGSFTGAKKQHRGYLEQAHEGILFLDEITEMDLELQSKLLKAIEDRKIRRVGGEKDILVDITIIAASNQNTEKALSENKLRQDLFHRLSVFCIDLPPLRERKEDLMDLVPAIIAEFNVKSGKHVTIIKDSTWEKLFDYHWPGNTRELRNVIERCVLFAEGEIFPERWLMLQNDCADSVPPELPEYIQPDELITYDLNNNQQPQGNANSEKISIDKDLPHCIFYLDGSQTLDEMEKEVIQSGLNQLEGNVTETARLLGISREKLRYRIKKYDL